MHKVEVYMTGWLAYFGIARMKETLRDWNGWLRRRIRMYIWKQWKNHAKDSTNKKHAASIADFSESLDIFRQHEFYQTILVFFTKDIITSRELNEIKHKFHSHLIEVRSFLTSKYSLR